jgi:hypothetical protein
MSKSTKRTRSILQESLEDSLRRRYDLDIPALTRQNSNTEPTANVNRSPIIDPFIHLYIIYSFIFYIRNLFLVEILR